MNFLIALLVNLAGMLVIYSWMAFALVQLRWRGHGGGAAVLAILAAGQFWILPPLALALGGLDVPTGALWLGNWLVSGFSVVILCQSARGIPRELADSARLDGCGSIGTYRHVVVPLVRRELGLIAFLTLMATATLFWIMRLAPQPQSVPPWLHLLLPMGLEHGPGLTRTLLALTGGSLVVTLPVIVIFFLSKNWFPRSAKVENR